MLRGLRLSVVIPTLNEAAGIRRTLALMAPCVDEVVVVDGGSTDKTTELARGAGAKIVVEPRRGYGRAFKTGFEKSSGDLIATTDGDGTYPVELAGEIACLLLDRGLDFVSCSRLPLRDASSMRRRNLIGNYAMTWAASLLWLHRFSDILSGMWVLRRSCLERLTLRSDGWNFSEEIKIEAHARLGNGFSESPIPYRERLGETKLIPWVVGIENLAYLSALRFRLPWLTTHKDSG